VIFITEIITYVCLVAIITIVTYFIRRCLLAGNTIWFRFRLQREQQNANKERRRERRDGN